MLTVTCKRCGNVGFVGTVGEVGALRIRGCRCCRLPHDHDVAANAGIICRPVHIEAPAGFQHVALLGGIPALPGQHPAT